MRPTHETEIDTALLDRDTTIHLVHRALSYLPHIQQYSLKMFFGIGNDKLTLKEIADVWDTSLDTARMNLNKAATTFKKIVVALETGEKPIGCDIKLISDAQFGKSIRDYLAELYKLQANTRFKDKIAHEIHSMEQLIKYY